MLWACNSPEDTRNQAIKDSLYKDDSLLSVYVMENLKQRSGDTIANDSNPDKKNVTALVLPLLNPDMRKPRKDTIESCDDAVVSPAVDSKKPTAVLPNPVSTPKMPTQKGAQTPITTTYPKPNPASSVQSSMKAPSAKPSVILPKPVEIAPSVTPPKPAENTPKPAESVKNEENKPKPEEAKVP